MIFCFGAKQFEGLFQGDRIRALIRIEMGIGDIDRSGNGAARIPVRDPDINQETTAIGWA
jgi:hypothetical protein